MKSYLAFLVGAASGFASVGDWRYYAWMARPHVLCCSGLNAWCQQVRRRPGAPPA